MSLQAVWGSGEGTCARSGLVQDLAHGARWPAGLSMPLLARGGGHLQAGRACWWKPHSSPAPSRAPRVRFQLRRCWARLPKSERPLTKPDKYFREESDLAHTLRPAGSWAFRVEPPQSRPLLPDSPKSSLFSPWSLSFQPPVTGSIRVTRAGPLIREDSCTQRLLSLPTRRMGRPQPGPSNGSLWIPLGWAL